MISDRHAKILEFRGFDIELLAQLGVESSDRLGGDCIAFPYHLNGELINWKYRTIAGEKRFSQEAGRGVIFWQNDRISDETTASQPLIITEGELDACAAIQAGFGRVVSVPNGAPAAELGLEGERYKFLDNAPGKALAECREIILAVDHDGPGHALLQDLSVRLGKYRCKFVKYPKGCKDLADALQSYGERGVVESINRAPWMEVGGIYRLSQLPPLPRVDARASGFPGLDKHYRLRPGDLTVVTGIPSHGKSTVVGDIACRMAMQHGWPVVFASFEQIPQRDHLRQLRTWFSGKRVINQSSAEIAKADQWIEDNFQFIVPADEDVVTFAWLQERLSTAVIRDGARLVVIDPWNEIEHERPQDMTMTEYTGAVLRDLKRFARKYLVHIIVVSHPAKMRRLENGKYPIPSMYDISDSSHWYNRCDVGVVVWRDEKSTIVRVAKSRFHDEIGTPGDVTVEYDQSTATFRLMQGDIKTHF